MAINIRVTLKGRATLRMDTLEAVILVSAAIRDAKRELEDHREGPTEIYWDHLRATIKQWERIEAAVSNPDSKAFGLRLTLAEIFAAEERGEDPTA